MHRWHGWMTTFWCGIARFSRPLWTLLIPTLLLAVPVSGALDVTLDHLASRRLAVPESRPLENRVAGHGDQLRAGEVVQGHGAHVVPRPAVLRRRVAEAHHQPPRRPRRGGRRPRAARPAQASPSACRAPSPAGVAQETSACPSEPTGWSPPGVWNGLRAGAHAKGLTTTIKTHCRGGEATPSGRSGNCAEFQSRFVMRSSTLSGPEKEPADGGGPQGSAKAIVPPAHATSGCCVGAAALLRGGPRNSKASREPERAPNPFPAHPNPFHSSSEKRRRAQHRSRKCRWKKKGDLPRTHLSPFCSQHLCVKSTPQQGKACTPG